MLTRLVSAFMSLCLMFSSLITGFFPVREKLRIVVPESWELCVGDSRTLECVFSERVTQRSLTWSVEPQDVATVDKWGRVTAVRTGKATVTARGNGFSDSVELNVVATPTIHQPTGKKVIDYGGESIETIENLQKIVTRYPHGSQEIPDFVSSVTDYEKHQTAVTTDGAEWEITAYGVLRTDKNAPTARDKEQRFMGDRYFYSNNSEADPVLAIFADGENGIWTVMSGGVSHIEMVILSDTDKAACMSARTQEFVSRHGLVAEAYLRDGQWQGYASDNDGLWTSMYGAGELMRYAALRDDPDATEQEIADARAAAYTSAEAVLLLYYISMRTGTTEAYVRRQTTQNIPGTAQDRWLSAEALEANGDPSVITPAKSPARLFNEAMATFTFFNSTADFKNKGFYTAVSADDWSDPAANPGTEYEKQTRLLEGFPARTFALKEENIGLYDNIYWSVNSDGTATGISTKKPGTNGYLLNNENLRGVTVDATGEVPERLWNNLIGENYSPEDIIYKTDTSADELIGHMFIFKLIYDILAPEDAEIEKLLSDAIDRLAQHLSDNSYMLVDATGQPTTWANFGRTLFCTGSSVAEISLHALVLLSVFKTAAYITGYEKWENEYRMAALDPAYEYAEVSSQHYERMLSAMQFTVADATITPLGNLVGTLKNTDLINLIYKLIVNYSSEEMAMLAFYTLFHLETDEEILNFYRQAADDWWISISCSENPLWYIIYQLAYPDKKIDDAYGNNIVCVAAWSLSRHPVDTVAYCASNALRDDIAQIGFTALLPTFSQTLTYNVSTSPEITPLTNESEIIDIVRFFLTASKLDWAIAAPDERALNKYNISTYSLTTYYNPRRMEGSTTYTLPFWMGVYHGIIERQGQNLPAEKG